MTLEELKRYFGSFSEMTRHLGLGVNSYQYWRRIGYIPYGKQLLIEKKTDGDLSAREVDGRPKNSYYKEDGTLHVESAE